MQISATAKVVERASGNVLFECPMAQMEEAYAFAVNMEEMEIEVDIRTPGLTESLAMELGAGEEDLELLKGDMGHEIAEHPVESCCTTGPMGPNK